MAAYNPLAEKAYEYMLEKINNKEFQANVYYSETMLAKEIGVSRTPMRDALMRLSQDRYIDIVPSKGFMLHVMSKEDIQNTYQIRVAIEAFCCVLLHRQRKTKARRRTIEDVRETTDLMKQAIEDKKSYDEILSHDFAFHKQIVEFSGNTDMIRLIDSYSHMQHDIAFKSFEQEGRPLAAYEEHMNIFRELISDSEDADVRIYAAVQHHMESSRDIALKQYGLI